VSFKIVPAVKLLLLEETLEDDENKCTRCGRTGHYSNKCYAKINIDNKEII